MTVIDLLVSSVIAMFGGLGVTAAVLWVTDWIDGYREADDAYRGREFPRW